MKHETYFNRKAELIEVPMGKIDPNPWRKLDEFPLEPHRLDALDASIQKTGIWPRILARKVGDRYEQAFGHHQIELMRRHGLKTCYLLVTEFNDGDMVQTLAHENGDPSTVSGSHVRNAVSAARDYLEQTVLIPAKNGQASVDTSLALFGGQLGLSKALHGHGNGKGFQCGVGMPVIHRFFNGGLSGHQIRLALEALPKTAFQLEVLGEVEEREAATAAEAERMAQIKRDAEAKAKAKADAAAEEDRKAEAEAKAMREAEEEARRAEAQAAEDKASAAEQKRLRKARLAAEEAKRDAEAEAKLKAEAAAEAKRQEAERARLTREAEKRAAAAKAKAEADAKAAAAAKAKAEREDAAVNPKALDEFTGQAHSAAFKAAILDRAFNKLGQPRKEAVRVEDQVALAKTVLAELTYRSDPLAGSRMWPTRSVKAENIYDRVMDDIYREGRSAGVFRAGWDLPLKEWRKHYWNLTVVEAGIVPASEVASLVPEFLRRQGLDLEAGGVAKDFEGLSERAFSDFIEGIEQSRRDAARWKDAVLRKATEQSQRVFKAIDEARLGLTALKDLQEQNDGLTFPQHTREMRKQIGWLTTQLDAIEAGNEGVSEDVAFTLSAVDIDDAIIIDG